MGFRSRIIGSPIIRIGRSSPLISGPSWDVDATSNIGVPADATQWDAFLAAQSIVKGSPDHLWLMQDPNTSLADVIGGVAWSPNGSPVYAQAISGWSRLGAGVDNSTGRFTISSGNGWAVNSTSVAMLVYVRLDAIATQEATVVSAGDGSNNWVLANFQPAGNIRCYSPGSGNSAIGTTIYEGGNVFPLLMVYDRTHKHARFFTTTEKLRISYQSSSADGVKQLGVNGGTSVTTARFLYGCVWEGSNAEFTETEAKTLLEGLGWTVAWTPDVQHWAVGSQVIANSGATLTVTLPTDIESGDFMLCSIRGAYGAGNTYATPSGWTAIPGTPQRDSTSNLGPLLQSFYRFYQPGDADPSFPDLASDDSKIGQIVTFKSVNASSPFDVDSGDDTAGSSGTAVSIPSDTTTVANTYVIGTVAHTIDVNGAQVGAHGGTNLTVIEEITDISNTTGGGGGFAIWGGYRITAGAYGPMTATLGTTSLQARHSIALRRA